MASDKKKKQPYVYIDIDHDARPPGIAHQRDQFVRANSRMGGQSSPNASNNAGIDDSDDDLQQIMPIVVPIFHNFTGVDRGAVPPYAQSPSPFIAQGYGNAPGYPGAPMQLGLSSPQMASTPLDERNSVQAYLQNQTAFDRGSGLYDFRADQYSNGLQNPGAIPGQSDMVQTGIPGVGLGAYNAPWSVPSYLPAHHAALQPYDPSFAQWYRPEGYDMPYGYAHGPSAGATGVMGAPSATGAIGVPGIAGLPSAAGSLSPYEQQHSIYDSPGSAPSPSSLYSAQGTPVHDYAKPQAYAAPQDPYGQQLAARNGGRAGGRSTSSSAVVDYESFASDGVGQPLLDEQAIAESSIFDEPSMSLEEGMRGMEKGRRRRKRVLIVLIVILVIAAATAAALIFIFHGDTDGDRGAESQLQSQTASSSSSSSSKSSSSKSSSASGSSSSSSSSSNNDGAGYVTFQYTATTNGGVSYTCKETVTFMSNGDCEFTTMEMEFPNAESASAFIDALANDYGNNFTLDSQDGAEATVTINNSGLHLSRKEYEQALRASVQDMVILEKK